MRTERETTNVESKHRYPIGALVELMHGPRLWVVYHATDCDANKTPLYCLSVNPNDTTVERTGFYNSSWVTGIPENLLTYIRMVNSDQ
jgi:hypothetical protein